MDAVSTRRTTDRSLAKASRRAALLEAAAQLFAEHGYNGVSIEDLGAAAGVSGPAVYRHFNGKQTVLAALLTGVSEDLLDGSSGVTATSQTAAESLKALIAFQVDFALRNANVIRVQDKDLGSLSPVDQQSVKSLQRRYVEVWVDVLAELHPGQDKAALRHRAHAGFGLINSTPHTTHRSTNNGDTAGLRRLLEDMSWAALNA